jgi:hypothetical protein
MEFSIEKLILDGAVEVSGVKQDTGEFLYSFTDKIKEILPEMYKRHLDFMHQEIMYFWEKGFLDVDDLGKSNPSITVTELAFNENALATLPPKRLETLNEIKRLLGVL